jgi:tRNA A58 N-methylase Trm61
MPYIFKGRISKTDVLVDVGCGKGRVINWWLSRGFRGRMFGIELDPGVAEATRQRLSKYKNVTIITADVCESIPEDATVFYLFNPFKPDVMERFKNRLFEVFAKRGVTVLYYNPWYVDVFKKDPNWTVEEVDLGFPSYFSQTGTYRILAIVRVSGKGQETATV